MDSIKNPPQILDSCYELPLFNKINPLSEKYLFSFQFPYFILLRCIKMNILWKLIVTKPLSQTILLAVGGLLSSQSLTS